MGTREMSVSPSIFITRLKRNICSFKTYVPCKEHQHNSHWLSSDEAAEASLFLAWHILTKDVACYAVQIFTSFDGCSDLLGCICDWPSHLLRKLFRQFIFFLVE